MGAADEIAKFHELLKSGAITQQEFDQAKNSILKNPGSEGQSRAFAPQTKPIQSKQAPVNHANQTSPSPVQIGGSVAAGYVAGNLIRDKLLNNDDVNGSIDSSLLGEGELLSASFVEMPSGDVFYQVSETVTFEGVLSENEVEQINQEIDSGENEGFFDFF